MNIGIIGAGNVGGTLARHLVKLDHRVSIASARGPERLAPLAAEIGATPVPVPDVASGADVLIVSIPQKAISELPRDLFEDVPSGVVAVDTGDYYPELRDGRIDALDRGMLDSQWVAQLLRRPGSRRSTRSSPGVYSRRACRPAPRGASRCRPQATGSTRRPSGRVLATGRPPVMSA